MKWTNIEINGFENKYKIREDGIVWNIKRNKELKSWEQDGYRRVSLQNKANRIHIFIHRLVALHFIGNPENDGLVINHIDSNRSNNHYTNLEWVTPQKNLGLMWTNRRIHNIQLECTNKVDSNFKNQLKQLVLSGDIKLLYKQKYVDINHNKVEVI